jgi:hypothetical protein
MRGDPVVAASLRTRRIVSATILSVQQLFPRVTNHEQGGMRKLYGDRVVVVTL